jgi:tRNA(Ile)-lysidine synthase
MKGKKKLSDYFINQKLSLHQKAEIPLLVNGNGDIIWVGGYRTDERYKVNNNTKKVTIFELYKI